MIKLVTTHLSCESRTYQFNFNFIKQITVTVFWGQTLSWLFSHIANANLKSKAFGCVDVLYLTVLLTDLMMLVFLLNTAKYFIIHSSYPFFLYASIPTSHNFATICGSLSGFEPVTSHILSNLMLEKDLVWFVNKICFLELGRCLFYKWTYVAWAQ